MSEIFSRIFSSDQTKNRNSFDGGSHEPAIKRKREEKPTYKNPNHCEKAFEIFDTMRRQNVLCDVVLVADGVEVPAHRLLLAGCSSYFYAMFTNFDERKRDRIEIKDVDSFALESLIEYTYTAEVHVTEENVQALCEAANLLQFSVVVDMCCNFLRTQLHPTNCLSIKAFADLLGCMNLLKVADTYFEENFSEVMEVDEFLSLPVCQVTEIIKNDRLMVPEEKMFECVVNWVKQDENNRQNHLPLLMEHIRFPLMSREYFLKNVVEEPLVRDNLQCSECINEAMKFHLPKLRECMQTMKTNLRHYQYRNALLVTTGRTSESGVECYKLHDRRWYSVSDMPFKRSYVGLAVIGNKAYVIGGCYRRYAEYASVQVYDIQADQWSNGIPMTVGRSALGVAVLNDKIYAVGGARILSSRTAEVFDPKTQQWKTISPMFRRRSHFDIGVLNNRLYAVGGYDHETRSSIDSVECYNPDSDTWHQVSSMSCKRSGVGVGVMNGILYAVGGCAGNIVQNSVEAYDPKTDEWKRITNMSYARKHAGVMSYNGLLYVIGGQNNKTSVVFIEVYNAQNDTWTVLAEPMRVECRGTRVALINGPSNLLDDNQRLECNYPS